MSLENVVLDVHELENGMETTKREYEASSTDSASPAAARMLGEFLSSAADKMKKLKQDCKAAQVRLVSLYWGQVQPCSI